MRLVIEVEDPEIVVQLRAAGKTVRSSGTMPKAEGAMQSEVDQTEAKDAGAAPAAPAMGPLTNISQTTETASMAMSKRLPGAGEIMTAAQPKPQPAQTSGEITMIDAGAPSADLLGSTPMRVGREN